MKHLLERLNRYEDERIDINNVHKVHSFLTDYIASSETYFSYFKIDKSRTIIPELPNYIVEYIKHINILRERKSKSKLKKAALPFFAIEEDTIMIPDNTYIFMYIVNNIYTLVVCMEVKGKMSLNLIPTYNRIFNFNSITLLSFDDSTDSIMSMVENKYVEIFNKVMEQLLYSFTEQNDLYDDLMLQAEI